MTATSQFRFRKLDTVGSADATEDADYLASCFIDTGDLEVISEISDPRRIIVGRTGAGKSALLSRLRDAQERIIDIEPASLALPYLSNSTILAFVQQLGVKLDIFFKLLWRHVITVEILKSHFHIETADEKATFVTRLVSRFAGKKEARALEYLEKWGRSFWEHTDYRIREITTTLERDLSDSIKASLGPVTIGLDSARKLTDEQKQDVSHRAQQVINQVQIQELAQVLDLLDTLLDDPQKRYFVVVDGLDEAWIEERVKYLLIRALIETTRDFRKVRRVKVVLALRWDLIDRVFRLTRDAGFQEEKYEALFLELKWSKEQLTSVLDARIDKLVKSRYTKATVSHSDLLPASIDGKPGLDYLLDRTMMRPRDLILFFNTCIVQAEGKEAISAKVLRQAEGEYSRARLRSLANEWFADYPSLLDFANLLKRRPGSFALRQIGDDACINLSIQMVTKGVVEGDGLGALARALMDESLSFEQFRSGVAGAFYKVGLVGLKISGYKGIHWSMGGRRIISSAEIDDDSKLSVHPCFWRALGVGSPDRDVL